MRNILFTNNNNASRGKLVGGIHPFRAANIIHFAEKTLKP
jgi:hypothetical protein